MTVETERGVVVALARLGDWKSIEASIRPARRKNKSPNEDFTKTIFFC